MRRLTSVASPGTSDTFRPPSLEQFLGSRNTESLQIKYCADNRVYRCGSEHRVAGLIFKPKLPVWRPRNPPQDFKNESISICCRLTLPWSTIVCMLSPDQYRIRWIDSSGSFAIDTLSSAPGFAASLNAAVPLVTVSLFEIDSPLYQCQAPELNMTIVGPKTNPNWPYRIQQRSRQLIALHQGRRS